MATHKLGNQTEPWIWPVLCTHIYIRPECSGVSSNSDSGADLTANKSPGESNSGAGERGGEGVMGPARGGGG